ncbi:MAG: CNNM domain-containing protein [Planctomycetota bacterium]
MDDMSTIMLAVWLFIAIFGTVDSAVWSGLETALYVVSRLRLEARLATPNASRAAKRLRKQLDEPKNALATLLVMNNFSNFISAYALGKVLEAAGLSPIAVTVIIPAVLAPVLFVFAETLPKEIFRSRAETLAYTFIPVLAFVRTVLTAVGIVPAVLLVTKGVERVLGVEAPSTDPAERTRALLQEAEGTGVLSSEQADLLNRAAAFSSTTVADEMTPWQRVKRLRDTEAPETAKRRAVEAGVSRLPLTDRRGQPVGIVRTIDLLLADPGQAPRDLATPPTTIDADTPVPDALAALHAARAPIAVVTSLGQPVGVVTAKDLVEPLTGELTAW